MTRSQRYGALAIASALVAVVTLLTPGSDTPHATTSESTVPAIEFELFEGGTARFDDFRGRPIVVNFWASWCPACIAELPEFQEVHEQLGDDVAFVGLANADQRDAAERFARDAGVTYTLADDPSGEMFVDFGLIAMPSTVFVTADGKIGDIFAGRLTAPALLERIEALGVAP